MNIISSARVSLSMFIIHVMAQLQFNIYNCENASSNINKVQTLYLASEKNRSTIGEWKWK